MGATWSLGVCSLQVLGLGPHPQALLEICPIHVEGALCVGLGISRGVRNLTRTPSHQKKKINKD